MKDCDTCIHSRLVVSENGFHGICCLSSRASLNCITGKKDQYAKNPMIKAGESNG